jgi:hypothetical protein
MLYLWLGARRPTLQSCNSVMVCRYYLGLPLRLHRGNSASENLLQETQWPKRCLYKTPYVAAPIRETGDVIARTPSYAQLPTDTPTRTRFFWFTSNAFLKRPILLKYWLLHLFFYEEATCKSSTKKRLLYAPENPEECKKGTLSDQPRLLHVISTALLSRWG